MNSENCDQHGRRRFFFSGSGKLSKVMGQALRLPVQPGRLPYNWWSLGFGLAAAAILVVFAVINFQSTHERREAIVASSAPQPETRTLPRGMEQSTSPGRFVSAGGAHVVYNARDEGLQFANGSERPVRRVRYQTRTNLAVA